MFLQLHFDTNITQHMRTHAGEPLSRSDNLKRLGLYASVQPDEILFAMQQSRDSQDSGIRFVLKVKNIGKESTNARVYNGY